MSQKQSNYWNLKPVDLECLTFKDFPRKEDLFSLKQAKIYNNTVKNLLKSIDETKIITAFRK